MRGKAEEKRQREEKFSAFRDWILIKEIAADRSKIFYEAAARRKQVRDLIIFRRTDK